MKQTKKILSVIILVILIAWLVYYINNNIQDFKQIELVNPLFIFPIILAMLFSLYITGQLNRELLKAFKIKLGHSEAFSLAVITRFYNFITPFRGGAVARAVYLKKKHEFPYTQFLATLSAIYILIFLVASFIGIVSIVLIYLLTGIFSWIIFIIFDIMFLGLIFIVIASPKIKERKNKWLNRFIRVINGWNLIKNNRRVILFTIILTTLQTIVNAILFWLQFRVFGIEIDMISCFFLSAVGGLGLLISITPGSLGIQEAIIVFSALTIGITVTESLSVSLLNRAISLVLVFILGPIFSYILIKNNPNKNERS